MIILFSIYICYIIKYTLQKPLSKTIIHYNNPPTLNPTTPTTPIPFHPHPHFPSAPPANTCTPDPFVPTPNPAVIYGANASVLDPTTTSLPPAAKLTRVPLTVIAPPAVSVCDPTMYWFWLSAVMVSEPMVMAGGSVVGVNASVLEPITKSLPPAAKLTLVPLTVITPPAVRVCEPTMYWFWSFAVMVSEPMVMAGGVVRVAGGVKRDVLGA